MYMHKKRLCIPQKYFSAVLFFQHLNRVDKGSKSLQNKLWQDSLELRFYNFKFGRGKSI